MILKIKGTSGGTWHLFDNVERFSYDTNRKEKDNNIKVPDEFFNIQNGNNFDEELEVLGNSALSSNEHSNSNFYQIATFQRNSKNYLIVFDTFAYLMGDDGETIERIGSKKTNQSNFGIGSKKKSSKELDSKEGVTISHIKETLRNAKPNIIGKSEEHEDLDQEAEVARNKFLAGIAETFNEAKESSADFDPFKEISEMATWIQNQEEGEKMERPSSTNSDLFKEKTKQRKEMKEHFDDFLDSNYESPSYKDTDKAKKENSKKPDPPRDAVIEEGGNISSQKVATLGGISNPSSSDNKDKN